MKKSSAIVTVFVLGSSILLLALVPLACGTLIFRPPFHTVYAERASQFTGNTALPSMSYSSMSPNFSFANQHALLGMWDRSCTAQTGEVTVSLAGIGFTMALFISELAFKSGDPELMQRYLAESKIGVFIASFIAGVVGLLVLRIGTKPASTE